MNAYNFKEIEQRWQKKWGGAKSHATPAPAKDRPPYYLLVMFPYPSGNLHMGHVRNYTIGDILARYYRKKGRAVLHPIGWDAFGMPAENAAIERGIHPHQWTQENIVNMRRQLKALGISYDWDREFATCDPDYYKWNQWFFIKMYEKGLVYRKKSPVNWCPKDATVLANEQVHNGRCWRCDSEVEQKELEQWFFKITAYAQELLDGHELLKPTHAQKGWPEEVLIMQKNWIGSSWGALVDFTVLDKGRRNSTDKLRVFTTRPDTLFGATFMVLAPEHPLVPKITTPDRMAAIEAYRKKAKKLSSMDRTAINREKTGEFTGAHAENPVNGEAIPIWIADYVLMEYGTGAIMAVPAHDERDFEFAKKFKIPIIEVIRPADKKGASPLTQAYIEEGIMANSGAYNGQRSEEAKYKIADDLKKKGLGEPTITYKLRDWLLSRQRYWGTPIPMLHCPQCGILPVHLKDLPVRLPENVKFTGAGDSPLALMKEWVETSCPKCQGKARRETDTMDTFVDSSWYYARYIDPKNDERPFDSSLAALWLPVTQYIGGIEHACMHLIYSRFFHKVMRDMGLVKSDEPFASLLTQGMVTLGGSAMSKSRGNVVDPEEVIEKYGADTCRLFILFAAPPTQQLEWSDTQVGGVWRFLNRVWRLAQSFVSDEDAKGLKRNVDAGAAEEGGTKAIAADELTRLTHLTIKRVTDDIEKDFGFNTALSAIMELVNALYLYPALGDTLSRESTRVVLELLSPFAPHMAEELWQALGHKTLLAERPWPAADEKKMAAQQIEIVIQVNGKLRDRLRVGASTSEREIKTLALQSLEKRGMKITGERVIYIPQKLLNFVEKGN